MEALTEVHRANTAEKGSHPNRLTPFTDAALV